MLVQIYDLDRFDQVTMLSQLVEGVVTLPHNESGQGSFVVPAGSPQLAPLVNTGTYFDLNKMLAPSSRYFAVVRDGKGNTIQQGRVTLIEPSEDGNAFTVIVNDMLDELRIVGLPPQRFFNGYFVNVITQILSYMPPSKQRLGVIPPSDTVYNEWWSISSSEDALNAWTTLDASNMSCLEALITACDNTGNNFSLNPDGTRSIRLYQEPSGSARPRANIVRGGFHAQEPAPATLQVIGEPLLTVENDTIVAGVFPEGGSYTDPDNVSRTLRLTGGEIVPEGYRKELVNGYWGIFNTSMVSNPVYSLIPDGQIAAQSFSSVVPVVNTEESVSAVIEQVAGRAIYAAAFDGYERNHWVGGQVRIGDRETTVSESYDDTLILADTIGIVVGDIVSVSVFRDWDANIVSDSRQSLAGASVAFLESRKQVQASWTVRTQISDVSINLGDYVRLLYSGSVQLVNRQSDASTIIPSLTISAVFAVNRKVVTMSQGTEYQELTLVDRMWRFPSNSGIRELAALIQRRMTGVTMGRDGSGTARQFIVTPTQSGAPLGYSGEISFLEVYTAAPQVVAVEPLLTGATAYATATTTGIQVQSNYAGPVRVSIVPTATVSYNVSGSLGGSIDATDVTYTPTDFAMWGSAADPGNVDGALDQLAARVSDIESPGAEDVSYAPAALTDWDNDIDPGNVNGALDQLAERVDDLENTVPDAADVTYTPDVLTDWDGGADPGNVDGALDQLAARMVDVESSGAGGCSSSATGTVQTTDAWLVIEDGCVVEIVYKPNVVTSEQATAMVAGLLMGAAMVDSVYGGE